MTHDSQRIAIAEACGLPKPYSRWSGADSDTLCHSVTVEDGLKRAKPIPDYTQDLNAMHEAEKVLKGGMRSTYDAELTLICSRDYNFIWESTAAQRAEAFLRTVGKWEDDK